MRAAINNWTDGLDAPPQKSHARLQALFPEADQSTLAWAWKMAAHPTTGTINCLALNAKGEMSGVTTTAGLAWKIPGRVGDSPIVGAGLYVDQEVGAAGCTGRGEENIRVAGAHSIVENMRHGMAPKEAILDALKRVARNTTTTGNASTSSTSTSTRCARMAPTPAARCGIRRGEQMDQPPEFFRERRRPSRHEPCVYFLESNGARNHVRVAG